MAASPEPHPGGGSALGDLPQDALFEARHHQRDPLLAVGYRDRNNKKDIGVAIVDLSGDVVRRIPTRDDMFPNRDDDVIVLLDRLDIVFFVRKLEPQCVSVLNPATGVSLALHRCYSEEISAERGGLSCIFSEIESYAFGEIPSTGVYKALRIIGFDQPGYSQEWRGSMALFNLETEVDGDNLWSGRGVWVKKFSLPSQFATFTVLPLLVLNDDRVVLRNGRKGFISYDPRTGVLANVLEVSRLSSTYFGTYRKSIEFIESSLLNR
uniref:DUF1618 domain-containing protein n=1 Tax=Oryza punctata TaxID=4537 RepID=A0A0E0LI83_ORYPU